MSLGKKRKLNRWWLNGLVVEGSREYLSLWKLYNELPWFSALLQFKDCFYLCQLGRLFRGWSISWGPILHTLAISLIIPSASGTSVSHLKIRGVSDLAFMSLLLLLFLISLKEDCFHTLHFKEQKVSGKVYIKSNKLVNNQEQILSESILSPLFPAWYCTCWLLWQRFPRIYPVLDLRSHSCKVLLVHDTQWISKYSDMYVGSSKIVVKYELEWNLFPNKYGKILSKII